MDYILITADSYTKGGVSKHAIDIALPRLQAGRWPLYSSTNYSDDISVGDRFLVYIGGIHKFKNCFISYFSANKIISKNLNDIDNNILDLTNKYPKKEIVFSEINLKEIKSVNIKDYLEVLDHTKHRKSKKLWGVCMMGGVRKISKKDYEFLKEKIS